MYLNSESILNLVTVLGKVFYVWPLDSNCCKKLKLIHQVTFYLFIINEILITIFLVAAIKNSALQSDYHSIIESISHIGSSVDTLVTLFICTYRTNDLKDLLINFTKFVTKTDGPTKKILHKYINNYLSLYPLAIISSCVTILTFTFAPIFSKYKFPLPTYHFLQIEKYSASYYLIYTWHIWIMCQSSISIFMCLTIPILMSMITTRLNILALKVINIKKNDQLKNWIQKHQKSIRYAEKLSNTLRFLIFKLYIATIMVIIFGSLPILYHQDYIELIRAILYVGVSLLLIFISAWAADDMHKASLEVSQAIYNSNWVNMSIKMRKSMIIIMCRAQKPLNISISGVLPALTLSFYAKYLSYALSYIMTLRAILL